jgi:hypothetical protein
MKTESLNAVMFDVFKNNRQVGKSLVEVYRTGSKRLVGKSLADRFGGRGQKVGDFLIKGIDKASDSAEGMMTDVCNRACGLLEKLDDSKYAARYMGLVGKIALPGAKFARNLSGKLAERVASNHPASGTGNHGRRVKHRPLHRKSAAGA